MLPLREKSSLNFHIKLLLTYNSPHLLNKILKNIHPICFFTTNSVFFLPQIAFLSKEPVYRTFCNVQAQLIASQAEKKQRQFDKVVDDWKRKVSDFQSELENSQKDGRSSTAEVFRLQAKLQEVTDALEALKRENKNLSGKRINI